MCRVRSWIGHGTRMGRPWVACGSPAGVYSWYMGRPWIAHTSLTGSPRVESGDPWMSDGSRMSFHPVCILDPWVVHGRLTLGPPMGDPCVSHGALVGPSWVNRGHEKPLPISCQHNRPWIFPEPLTFNGFYC